jgi:hypothetical protein
MILNWRSLFVWNMCCDLMHDRLIDFFLMRRPSHVCVCALTYLSLIWSHSWKNCSYWSFSNIMVCPHTRATMCRHFLMKHFMAYRLVMMDQSRSPDTFLTLSPWTSACEDMWQYILRMSVDDICNLHARIIKAIWNDDPYMSRIGTLA